MVCGGPIGHQKKTLIAILSMKAYHDLSNYRSMIMISHSRVKRFIEMSYPFGGSGSIKTPICQFHELISPVAIAASSRGGLGPLSKVRDAHWWLGGSHNTKTSPSGNSELHPENYDGFLS